MAEQQSGSAFIFRSVSFVSFGIPQLVVLLVNGCAMCRSIYRGLEPPDCKKR